ncbi:serine/arginine repetitive matrix protein 1-like [Diachasma alloeum]|uniref:serine/arginine repetitive matrix protein 1-like n=1 Tax=Diachasma alloeum TaxID=454923 RepID=UPI0007384903|nr:serine/arginine repetitive matrix protein 1-like [Diachasma alloeum]
MTLSEFKPPNSSTPEVDSNSDLLLMDMTEDDRQLEVLTGASSNGGAPPKPVAPPDHQNPAPAASTGATRRPRTLVDSPTATSGSSGERPAPRVVPPLWPSPNHPLSTSWADQVEEMRWREVRATHRKESQATRPDRPHPLYPLYSSPLDDWDNEETPSTEAPGKRKRPTRRGGRQKRIEAAIARQAAAAASSAAGAPTGHSAPTLQPAPPKVPPPQVVQPPPKIPAGPLPPMPEPQWDMHCAALSKGRGRGRLRYRHMAHTNGSPSPLGGEWRIVPAPQSKDPQRTSRRAKPERPRQEPSQARRSPRRRSPERPTQRTRPTSPRPRRDFSPRRKHSPSRRRSPRQRRSSDHSRESEQKRSPNPSAEAMLSLVKALTQQLTESYMREDRSSSPPRRRRSPP